MREVEKLAREYVKEQNYPGSLANQAACDAYIAAFKKFKELATDEALRNNRGHIHLGEIAFIGERDVCE